MSNPTLNLESVQSAFKAWRSRKRNGESIPDYLWEQVKQLMGHYSRGTIQGKLRITTDQMRKQGLAPEVPATPKKPLLTPKAKPQGCNNTFISTAPSLPPMIQQQQSTIELARADGTTLRCYQLEPEQFRVLLQQFTGGC